MKQRKHDGAKAHIQVEESPTTCDGKDQAERKDVARLRPSRVCVSLEAPHAAGLGWLVVRIDRTSVSRVGQLMLFNCRTT